MKRAPEKLRIRTRVFGLETGGAGAPIVLVPGLSVSSRYMLPLARQLMTTEQVLVVDPPGAGRSSKPPRVLSPHEEAALLAAWARQVRLPPAVWVGNSLGCHALLHLGAHHPERVLALVLVGPPFEPWGRHRGHQVLRFARTALDEPAALWGIALRDYLRAGMWRTWRKMSLGTFDPVERVAPRVLAPTLVIRGDKDRIATPQWIRTLARLLPRGRAMTIRRAVHAVNFDAPDALDQAIRAFLVDVRTWSRMEAATRSGASMLEKWPTPGR